MHATPHVNIRDRQVFVPVYIGNNGALRFYRGALSQHVEIGIGQ
jgi:hypothetical protein